MPPQKKSATPDDKITQLLAKVGAQKAAIAAAMARAKAQRETARPKNTHELTPAQAKTLAEIDTRRETAGIAGAPANSESENP